MQFSNSPLSSANLINPLMLRVNVIISRSADYDGTLTGSIEVFIRDEADKPVANASIQVKVNGQILTDSAFFVEANASYSITVVLTNSQEYPLGTIQTLPAITPAQFLPPVRHSRRQPLRLAWHHLEPHNWFASQWRRWQGETSATSLKIAKSNSANKLLNDPQAEEGSLNTADYLMIPVGAGEEAYTVPQSYFEGLSTQFNCLDLQIDSEKNLIVNKPFREGSVISSVNTTRYKIEVTD